MSMFPGSSKYKNMYAKANQTDVPKKKTKKKQCKLILMLSKKKPVQNVGE